MFRQYGLVSAPVTDADGRLFGVITADDVVHVIHEEAEEDIMRLGGVSGDDFYAAVLDTTRARSPWLFVHLGTSFVAASVIGLFADTIEKVVVLTVLMPFLASLGRIVLRSTLTFHVRCLVMKGVTG